MKLGDLMTIRKLAAAIGVVASLGSSSVWIATPAVAEVVITIDVDQVAVGAPGSVHLLETVEVDDDDVGRECEVIAEGQNNDSVHPNSDLIISSGTDGVVVPDVEREPNVITEATGTLTLGDEVTVEVQLGADGAFSGGFVVTIDCLPPAAGLCVENVNPHGENIPPAGSSTLPGAQGGQNEDGFYLISSTTGADVFVVDTGTGTVFGPYPSGTVVKYTEANGKEPSEKKIGSENGEAGAVLVHIQGQGDMGVRTATSGVTVCFVPPPPK